MSRIGKYPVKVVEGVTVTIEGSAVSVKGKLGVLSHKFGAGVSLALEDQAVVVRPLDDRKESRMLWGTARSVIAGMVTGVSEGFKKELELQGVGYRAFMKGVDLDLQLGFSHDVLYKTPAGVKISCPSQTEIVVEGFDKAKVGQVAAEIRSYRPPEPYKGKGVRYKGEKVVRKEGKKK